MKENNVFPETIWSDSYKIVFGVKTAWQKMDDPTNNFMVGPVIVPSVDQIVGALNEMIKDAYHELGANLYFHSFTIKNLTDEELAKCK